jgi:Tol biopolymer transport system component
MSDAGDAQRCGRCGAEFTALSTPLGLCPACLLKLGMSDPAMTPAQEPEPEPEPVAPLGPAPPGPTPPAPVAPARARRRLRLPQRRVWLTAAALLVIAVLATQFFPRLQRREPAGVHGTAVRFTLTLPDETEIADGAQLAVSADGTQLVVAARQAGGPQRLWLRRLQSSEWRELPRTDGATFPFWSPDSRHVGFFTDRRLMRIEVTNGLTRTVCDVRSGHGGTWGIQDDIVFADAAGLSRVPASGGVPVAVTKVDSSDNQRAHLWPHFLPDGRHFVFLVQKANDEVATHIRSVDTGESMAIADGRGPSAFVAYVLLFARGATLATQRFDQTTGVIGEVETIGGVEEIAGSLTAGSAFSASSTVLVYRREEERRRQLTWFGREGRHFGVVGKPAEYTGFALSPDGRRVAVARRGDDEASSVWVMDVSSDRVSRLTAGRERDAFPLWSPDGSRIAFSSRGSDADSVRAVIVDTGEMEEELFRSPESKHLTDWSLDNRFLIYAARSPKTGMDLWLLPTMGDRKPQPFHQTPANESQGRSSPDGRWIAYVSDQSGSEEVYVRAFPPSEGRWQISTAGGTRPRWRSDGRELFFLSTDGQLMAVDVTSGPTPRYEAPRRILDVRGADDFAVSRDGRFLVPLPVNERRDRELHVVLNWAAERRR